MNPISKANSEIAAILKRLEESTGCVVDSVEIVRQEVTTLADFQENYLCYVCVHVRRLPGQQWAI